MVAAGAGAYFLVHRGSKVSMPPGSHIVPIQIVNDQASGTPAPFDAQVVVDSSAYASFEADNLQNLQFTDQTGHVIPSWLESGNSSSSTRSVYWLRLASGIPAKSTVTVNMMFDPLTQNLFNNSTTGEAADLSAQYGQYDNGFQIFTRYENFTGTALPPGWSVSVTPGSSGAVTVNNGATISQEGAGDQRTFLGSNWAVGDNLVEMHLLSESTSNAQDMIMVCTRNGRLDGLTSNSIGFQNGSGLIVESNSGGAPSVLAQANPNPALPAVIGFDGDTVFANYRPVMAVGNSVCGSTFLAASANTGSNASFSFDWVRMRPAPPGNVMPRVVVEENPTLSGPPGPTRSADKNEETNALNSLHALITAEVSYSSAYPAIGFTASLGALGPAQGTPDQNHAGLIDADLASGTKDGYQFTVTIPPGTSTGGTNFNYFIVAKPVTGYVGRTFCADSSGTIRSTPQGQECTTASPPV